MMPRFLVLFCASFALQSCVAEPERGPLILAPASSLEAMEDIADAWAAKGHARPVLSIAGTPAIARQAAEGASADIIITADEEWMDWLEERNALFDDTRRPLLTNGLALVRSPEADPAINLQTPQSSLATGDPDSVPIGRYARKILAERMEWEGFMVPTDSVRAALSLVESGEVDFAFVYTSDLRNHGEALQVLETWTQIDGETIVYPMAILRSARHPAREEVYRFMLSEEASEIFGRHGFGRPEMIR